MNKIYKLIHCGTKYYVDTMGLRKFFFDMLVNDINERDFDTIEWLDDTRDLDIQLDLMKLAKIGDIETMIYHFKRYELGGVELQELKSYKDILQFYVDYLNGEITEYYLYDNIGLPYHEMIKVILDKLNNAAKYYATGDYDILLALIETKAYEIDEFEDLFKKTYTSVFKEFEDFLEDFNTRVYRYAYEKDKVANIDANDSRNLDDLLNVLLKLQKNL